MAQEVGLVAASSRHGEMEDVLEGCASSMAVSPDFLTPMQSLSSCSIQSGTQAATTSAASGPSSSPFFSARIQSLSERRTDLGSQSEFEIESSKSHWTETSDAASSDFDDEDERVSDRIAFEKLKEHPEWGPFFRRQPFELEIGEKIAEGGQAEIFEALGTNKHDYISTRYVHERTRLVVKVFKKGIRLRDVQRLWPPGLASAALPYRYFPRTYSESIISLRYGLCFSVGAQLLDDGRFAFIFDRYSCDLRTLVDRRMLKSNGAPPFSLRGTHLILWNIAKGMAMLHNFGLLHKGLKAANVLTLSKVALIPRLYAAYIADFESSVGIVGTGFWRAPEVLLALKNGKKLPFTQQSDVYSYAMTCYEVLTGRVPFEGHPACDYDMILRGARPPLPDDIDPFFKDLLRKCWHADPRERPSFHEIVAIFWRTADDVKYEYVPPFIKQEEFKRMKL